KRKILNSDGREIKAGTPIHYEDLVKGIRTEDLPNAMARSNIHTFRTVFEKSGFPCKIPKAKDGKYILEVQE
ncbi:MAG TPA: hypothetical protein P5184_04900, partial [Bacteroidales bacterium]|nr:hypothetical protein [Bacteroidales bacterium]